MRVSAVAALGCWLLTPALAAEEAISLELLEFLGSFETVDGKWIDPTQLEPPAQPAAAVSDAEENSDD